MKYVLQEGEKRISGICPIPFAVAQTYDWGNSLEIFSCCPNTVMSRNFGIIDDENKFEHVWNSERAVNFRSKVLKQDYSMCNLNDCNVGLMKQHLDFLNGKEIEYNAVSNYPIIVKFSHDRECNLCCTTCRDKLKINTKREIDLLNKKIDTVFLPMLQKAKLVYLAGDGEVFFSRHYKTLIDKINKMYPDIKYALHTNGLLFNRKNCEKLGIIDKLYSATISIFSLKKAMYERLMKGAKYNILIKNLDWLLEMKRSEKIKYIYFNCVIQKQNYKEMPEFVWFAQTHEGSVRFTKLGSWGTSLNCNDESVFNENNSEFDLYVKMLYNPVFRNSNCYLDPKSESLVK